MSAAAWSVPPERDDVDPKREAARLRKIVEALAKISLKRPSERRFVVEMTRADLAAIGPATKGKIEWLAWKYRRALPREVAPRLNPNDPIVREMAAR